MCEYQTKHRVSLRKHLLVHKDISEVQMFKCEKCEYQTKYKGALNRHWTVHGVIVLPHEYHSEESLSGIMNGSRKFKVWPYCPSVIGGPSKFTDKNEEGPNEKAYLAVEGFYVINILYSLRSDKFPLRGNNSIKVCSIPRGYPEIGKFGTFEQKDNRKEHNYQGCGPRWGFRYGDHFFVMPILATEKDRCCK
ncbi:hypothetical protein NQ317_011791 [Molorchus minor]|uniref:C2H2-type domain-containing protein n=1 Tax=Molorchus minor TaxID=1323400 RepID=A0ABQ9J6B0_9CUCU|nr:hypothetical protein NQ317_011791 [Molorchus minor]